MPIRLRTRLTVLVLMAALVGSSAANEIRQQQFDMTPPAAGDVRESALLAGELAEVATDHVAVTGPCSNPEPLSKAYDTVLLFLNGIGSLQAGDKTLAIEPETIALPTSLPSVTVDVEAGETLHYLRIRKQLSPADLEEIKDLPLRDAGIYFKRFTDCRPYTEAIKSAKTISRTVLPKDYAPRLAMGTVETSGPDAVGAHEHPMLDQLFLGLADNDIIVYADDAKVRFTGYSLLHIPLGSSHWVEAEEGRRMYYMWMDFFLTKEGQEWLKTHKHVDGYDE